MLKLRGQLVDERRKAPHLAHLLQLREKVRQIKSIAAFELGCEFFSGRLIDPFLCLFDERHNIAHAENTLRHPIGMEGIESVEFFADPDKLDRLTGDMADRKCSTPARIAVELGQHNPGEWQRFAEGPCGIHRVLALHGVDHKEGFDRLEYVVQRADLGHHFGIDPQSPSRINQQHVVVMRARPLDSGARNVHGLLVRGRGEPVGIDLRRDGL